MKLIPVYSKKYGSKWAYIDDDDFKIIGRFHWTLGRVHNKSGGFTDYAYSHEPLNHKKRFSMHRLVLGVTDPKILVDHKDRDGLNNQRANLRTATYGQNSQNKGVCHRNEAGFKGVVMNKENKYRKYCAVIIADGIRVFGGGFKYAEEAAYRWNEMARKYHGEFAYQNPITAIKYVDGMMYTTEIRRGSVIEQSKLFVRPYLKRT